MLGSDHKVTDRERGEGWEVGGRQGKKKRLKKGGGEKRMDDGL